MDADLQDPPELLPQMVELLQQGYDVVSPQRASRCGETWFKRWTAAVFYRFMARMAEGRLIADKGDFRMFSRRAVTAIRSLREQHRFMRGLVAWLGLREAILPFERQPRAGGETKYSLLKMLRFTWTAVSSFSALPPGLSTAASALLSCAGFVCLSYVVYLASWTKSQAPGWASVVVLQCIFSGMILLALGMIGDYVARSYEESKGRPLYIVTSAVNMIEPENEIARASILAERDLGELLSLAGGAFGQAAGCDPSTRMIHSCASAKAYQQPSSTELPFDDQSFDFVTAVCVYHHVHGADRELLTKSIDRVLRPGGVFCLIEHNPWNPVTRLIVKRRPVDSDAELLTPSLAAGLARAANAANLEVIETAYLLYFPENIFRHIGKAERFLRKWRLGGQFAVFYRKSGKSLE